MGREFSKRFFERGEEEVVGKIAKKEERERKRGETERGAVRAKPTPEEQRAARERMARDMEKFLKLTPEEIKIKAEAEKRALTPEEIEMIREKEMREKLSAAEKYEVHGETMEEKIGEEEKKRLNEEKREGKEGTWGGFERRGHRKGLKPPKVERKTIREREKMPKEVKEAIRKREEIEEWEREEREKAA
jgi:hypothetical protein